MPEDLADVEKSDAAFQGFNSCPIGTPIRAAGGAEKHLAYDQSSMADPIPTPPAEPKRGERYFTNVLWNWFSVTVNLLIRFFPSPYIIRKLEAEGYGLWALLFTLNPVKCR